MKAHLVIEWHDNHPSHFDQVLHEVLVFWGTGSTTVHTVIQAAVGAEQQAVAHHELGFTELKFVKGQACLLEVLKAISGILNDIRMELQAVVNAIGA